LILLPGSPPGPGEDAAGDEPTRSRSRRAWWRRLRTGDWAIDVTCLGVVLMGFNRWRVGEYPLSDFIFVAAAGIIFVRLLTGRTNTLAPAEARRSSPLVVVGALVLLTAGTLSSFGAWDVLGSIGVVLRLAWLTLFWFWILRSITTRREVFYRLLRAWRLGVMIIAVVATTGELGLTNFSVENNEGRQTAFFGHPNDLAGYLIVALPLVVLWVPRTETGSRRAIKQIAGIALVGFAIATTGSMSAAIGAIVGLVSMFVVLLLTRDPRRSKRRHPLFVMLVLTGIGIGFVLLSTSDLPVVNRLSEYNQGGTGVSTSVESRGLRNRLATDRVDELLVVGIGLDHKSGGKLMELPDSPDALFETGVHNMHLKVLLEAGLPGLIGLWIILWTTALQAWRLMLSTRNDTLHTTTAALFGSMVTVNVFAMFQPTLYHRYYWYPIALIGTLWAVRRQELRQAGTASSEADAPAPRRPRVA